MLAVDPDFRRQPLCLLSYEVSIFPACSRKQPEGSDRHLVKQKLFAPNPNVSMPRIKPWFYSHVVKPGFKFHSF